MSSVLGLAAALLLWLWVFYLPGWVLTRVLVPDATGTERHGLALFCGFSTLPLLVFLLTVLLEMPVDAASLVLFAGAINLGGGFVLYRRHGRDGLLDVGKRDTLLVVALFAFVVVHLLFGMRSLDGGDVFSTVQHCLYVIVMHTVANDASQALPLYDGVTDQAMHFLVQHPTTEFNGLAPLFYEQRLGNAAILAPHVALFGTAGWFICAVNATVVTGMCVYNAARTLGARPVAAAIGAFAFAFGIRTFTLYFVNENNYAVAIVAFCLWIALQKRISWGRLALLGLAAGHLVGVRYTSVLFWPGIAAAVLWTEGTWKQRWSRVGVGAAFCLLAALPWFFVNFMMLGTPFGHPKVHSEFRSRVVVNQLLGSQFHFRALNWPFTDDIVRTPWSPFPTLIWLALWVCRSFGSLLVTLGVMGWFTTKRLAGHRALALLLLFALPHTLALGLMESLDWEQLTYLAPGLVPLGVIIAVGLETLLELGAGPLRTRMLMVSLGVFVVLSVGIRAPRNVDWAVDTRLLNPEHWPTPPTRDAGLAAVAEDLTGFHPLPRLPVLQTRLAGLTWRALGSVLDTRMAPEEESGTWSYPSGQLAILIGYASDTAREYNFRIDGSTPRTAGTEVRTGIGLHQVSLLLAAEQIEVVVQHIDGEYNVDIEIIGDTGALHDFTFYLNPWSPAARAVHVHQPGVELVGLRTETYGGSPELEEQRLLVTNYPRPVLGLVDWPFTVDRAGDPGNCGLFVFLRDVDTQYYERLILAGGHAVNWSGETSGVLRVPAGLKANEVLLFSEPYCSDHVPQPGDRFGVVDLPPNPNRPLHFRLDRRW